MAQKLDSVFAENPKHPGTPRSNHTDPGPNWPMDAYLGMVRAALPAPAPVVDAPADPVDAGSVEAAP